MNVHKKKKTNILVVEDSETGGILLKSLLEEHIQIEVHIVNSGQNALLFDKKNIDLILLDLMMPDIDGFEVLRQLKADLKTKEIPVIIVSARNSRTDKNLAKSLGAKQYITKPIDANIFFNQLELDKL